MDCAVSAAIEIPALLARYADAFDAGDFAAAAALFDGGCVVVGGQEIAGAEAIVAMWRRHVRLYPCGTPRTRHLVTNPAISLHEDGARAECRSQWTVFQQPPGQPLTIVGTGRYHDRFRHDGHAWRFARRIYGPADLWGEPAHHLLTLPTTKDATDGTL